MNQYPGADQDDNDAPALLQNNDLSQHNIQHNTSFNSSIDSSPRLVSASLPTRSIRPASIPFNLEKPEDFYKHPNADQAASANFQSVHQNAFYNSSSSSMASTVSASPPTNFKPSTSSKFNGNGMAYKNLDFPRRDGLKPVGLRTVSDPVRPNPAIGANTRGNVRELASRFNKQQAELGPPQSKPVGPPKSMLPVSHRPTRPLKELNTPSNNTKVESRIGQPARDAVAKGGPTVGTINGKSAPENHEQLATSKNRTYTSQRSPPIRKPVGTPPSKISLATPSATHPPPSQPLLFGEVPANTQNGVGYGIPSYHSHCSSDSAENLAAAAVSDDSNDSCEKQSHSRKVSDTSVKKTNGSVTRRPLYKPPSSRSSSCSDSGKQSSSRIPPPGKRLSNNSDSSDSPTTLKAPFSVRAPQKFQAKSTSQLRGANGRVASDPVSLSYQRNVPASARTTQLPVPTQINARVSVANKTTTASRSRELETSRTRAPDLGDSPKRTRGARQNDIPLENVDFASRRTSIRQRTSLSIHRQEQTEIRRQQSLRAQIAPEITPAAENTKEVNEHSEKLGIVPENDSSESRVEVGSEHRNLEPHTAPLMVDTAPAHTNALGLSISKILHQPSDDSPTLGIPGSFPSAQTSPIFEEAPPSAVSNTTETTDIENDPQDNFQMPGGFNELSVPPSRAESVAEGRPAEAYLQPVESFLRESENVQREPEIQSNGMAPGISVEESTVTSNGDAQSLNHEVSVPIQMNHSEQYLRPDGHEVLRTQVQRSLRDPDEESLYELPNYGPSDSLPRTPHTPSFNDGGSATDGMWTDRSIGTVSDVDVCEEKLPTPPPKTRPEAISTGSSFAEVKFYEGQPLTPINPPLSTNTSPRRPLSFSGPEVPPKPANYSPAPSPRMMPPSPRFVDSVPPPPSPASDYGNATVVINSHRRTSSNTPHFTPSTGWIAKPPVPGSRPPSISIDRASDQSSIRTSESSAVTDLSQRGVVLDEGAKRLKDRWNIIKEIVDSEAKHVKDMFVVKEIWLGTADACPTLMDGDKEILFMNIGDVAATSAKFLDKLKKANAVVVGGRKSRGSRSPSEGSPITSAQDHLTSIGAVFVEFISEIESVNWPFIMKYQEAEHHLDTLLKESAISIWNAECCRAMVDISECWDLKSLLIKPFQRAIKYKDLLERLATKTDPTHPDWNHIQQALSEMKSFLKRLNQAMPPPEPPKQTPKTPKSATKNKELERSDRMGFMKGLGRKPGKGSPGADEDLDFLRLRNVFGTEYVRLQVILRDVEFYVSQVDDFGTKFLETLSAMHAFMAMKHRSTHTEIEVKWQQFTAEMESMRKMALPDHIEAVQKHIIAPFEQLIVIYQSPNIRIAERDKRRSDWEKIMSKKGGIPKELKSKTEKSAERYQTLNEQLKRELPILSLKTNQIGQFCLKRLVGLQKQLYGTWMQKLGSEKIFGDNKIITPTVESIMDDFHRVFPFNDNNMRQQLSIINPSFLRDVLAGRSSLSDSLSERQSFSRTERSRDSREQRSRPPSSNGKNRPPPLSRARAGSSSYGVSLPTPDFGRHNDGGFFSPLQPTIPVSPYMAQSTTPESSSRSQDNISISETLVTTRSGRPSTSTNRLPLRSHDSTPDEHTRKPSEPNESTTKTARDSGTGSFWRRISDPSEKSVDYYDKSRPVSGSTTFSRIEGPTGNTRPPSGLDTPNAHYSGVFQSAMPASDVADTNNPRISRASSFSSLGNDDRGRGDGYNVLYLAASLFEFQIPDTKREGIYPYLTYMPGELFDVIGEKGELWLAKNQDDPPDNIKVGWIWSKHFARLAD